MIPTIKRRTVQLTEDTRRVLAVYLTAQGFTGRSQAIISALHRTPEALPPYPLRRDGGPTIGADLRLPVGVWRQVDNIARCGECSISDALAWLVRLP